MGSSYLRSLRQNAVNGDLAIYNAATARFELGSARAAGGQIYVNSEAGARAGE